MEQIKGKNSTDLTETFDLHEPEPLFHTLSDVLVDVSQNPSVQEHSEALGHRSHGWGVARGRSHGEQEVGQVFVTQVRRHSLQQVGIQNY